GEGARRHVLQVARRTAGDLPSVRRKRGAQTTGVLQPAAVGGLRSAARGAVPRGVGVVGPVPGAVSRRQTPRRVLCERVRPEGAAEVGAGVAVAARSSAGTSFPDLAATRAQ